MIIRIQMGPYPDGLSWDALELNVALWRRQIPDTACIHVVHQGPIARHISGVDVWHRQTLPEGVPYCSGRHTPEKLMDDEHELYCDNDHFMWELPEGVKRFFERGDSVLIWKADWMYYGGWGGEVDQVRQRLSDSSWNASAGMWGVPPGVVMRFDPSVVYRGYEKNQDEYGYVVAWLGSQRHHEYVTQEEVPVYCPDHNALKHKDRLGTHGVHLNGTNRPGWNRKGEEMLYELRRKYL